MAMPCKEPVQIALERQPSSVEAAALALPASLDLTAAEPLWRSLLERLGRDGAIEIDGSAVERVSTACLQVLVAAKRAAGLRIVAPSATLADAVRDLGLVQALGMEVG